MGVASTQLCGQVKVGSRAAWSYFLGPLIRRLLRCGPSERSSQGYSFKDLIVFGVRSSVPGLIYPRALT